MAMEGTTKCLNNNDDMGDGMQCSDHPYRNNPGGICAFCLQEKLGKLVSSSFPLPIIRSIHSSSSSASSPAAATAASFRSDLNHTTINAASVSARTRNDVPFLLSIVMAKQSKKKKKKVTVVAASSSSSSSAEQNGVVFKRSKSTTAARRGRFVDQNDELSPRVKRGGGFWSFLHLYSSSSASSARNSKTASFSSVTSAGLATTRSREKRSDGEAREPVVLEENDVSFDRKVSRSRSVGCGSRSFSGDFFERISTGFGDCTLRRVESQREGKTAKHNARDEHCMKERVKCGGIFGGFILTSASSSSSEWDVNGPKPGPGSLFHGRNRSWGWAFASPIRALTKPSGPNSGKRDIIRQASGKSASTAATTPNLAAIPSLLTVRG